MSTDQTRSNPDVNSFEIDDTSESEGSNDSGTTGDIPVPPDVEPQSPVEEPPGSGGPPVGDVDDSPKKIA